MNPIPWLIPGPLHAVVAMLLLVWLAGRARPSLGACWRWTLVLVALWTWLAATPALGNLMVSHLERQHPPVPPQQRNRAANGQVIVLASGQLHRPDGRADPVLDADGWERLRAGIALWRDVGGQLVLAGGPGQGEHDSFAALMRRTALEAGIPDHAILMAAGSHNTYGDLRAVAAVLDGSPAGSRWLVTSALHMPRALATAQALNLQLRPFPCGFRHLSSPAWRAWLPDNGDATLWRDGLHEWPGLVVYRLRGWA